MKLIEDSGTYLVEGFPFGIEKISARDWVIFRMWGSRRIYIREEGFISKAQAIDYLTPMVEKYEASIITAITA